MSLYTVFALGMAESVPNCVLPATVCGVCLPGMFSWAALSPVQSCLLFSFMKINETVQSSAEASRALLTEEAFRLPQALSSTLSRQFRETEREHCNQVLLQNDNRKRAREEFANAECQSQQSCSNAPYEKQIGK